MAAITDSATIDSPCIKLCVIEPGSGLCRGCNRRIEEIARWGTMSAAERARIMSQLPRRGHPAPAVR